ncbi:hypothetical protein LZ31DRAFT_555979 [Colletotrichum somersetense]|nr:hypothetical protein LZ31DRAFT_555979 [Colletotrichum somersetense]
MSRHFDHAARQRHDKKVACSYYTTVDSLRSDASKMDVFLHAFWRGFIASLAFASPGLLMEVCDRNTGKFVPLGT